MSPRSWRLGVLAALLLSCAPQPRPWQSPSLQQWTQAQRSLDALRRTVPRTPWLANVAVALREPRSGREYRGRGGVAVAPGRAARMILTGPLGATTMDAWVTNDAWRVAIPPMHSVRRGGRESVDDAMPVGFFRWWLLAPLAGRILAASPEGIFVLRTTDAAIELWPGRAGPCQLLCAKRVAHGRAETIAWFGAEFAPRGGDWGEYADEATGVRVRIEIESVEPRAPGEDAFRDPDEPPAPSDDGGPDYLEDAR